MDGSDGLSFMHDVEAERYEAWRNDDLVGVVEYERAGDTVTIVHTEIDPGQGDFDEANDDLIIHALDDLLAQEVSVVIDDEAVAAFVAAHPDYAENLAD